MEQRLDPELPLFADRTGPAGFAPRPGPRHGAPDYDNDGDQDIVIFNNEGRPALLRNNAIHPGRPAAGGWLRVFLDASGDPAAAPSGFGARLVVTAVQDRPRPRCGSPPRLAPFHDVLAHGVAAHPRSRAIC